jgi:hypothetical protein
LLFIIIIVLSRAHWFLCVLGSLKNVRDSIHTRPGGGDKKTIIISVPRESGEKANPRDYGVGALVD